MRLAAYVLILVVLAVVTSTAAASTDLSSATTRQAAGPVKLPAGERKSDGGNFRGRRPAWGWPLAERSRPLRRFDPPAQRWLAGHRGVDLAVSAGEEVLAVGQGTVSLAGRVADRDVVVIDHSNGLRTTYLPVLPLVRPGESVTAGQVIGTIEEAGAHCRVPCLHWGLLRGNFYLDPLLLFGHGEVRLLPMWSERRRLILYGMGEVEAYKQVDIGRKSGYRWRAENGGLPPARLAESAHSDRYPLGRRHISTLRGQGLGVRASARPGACRRWWPS
ncbi:M23 family metallopeptidase [Microbispora sp. NEAU-D428]|uniref:M23 family metallopeptidase n=1 Tax=Microbispora sitophila TaxID=2771537 RepID=UPI001867A193|nr:M23 family metallopeptidase [Microbispora sitophila]MBE3015392.1 M23 family metallopeptidase [Microbispora sitophila]